MEGSHKAREGVVTNQKTEPVTAVNENVSLATSANEKSSSASAPANHTLLSVSANHKVTSSVSPPKRKPSPSPTNQHAIKSMKTNQKAEVASASAHETPPSLESTNYTVPAPAVDISS